MEPKKIALLAGALIIAVATAFLARSMFADGGAGAPQAGAAAAAAAEANMPRVLVATKPLPIGTIVGPDAYRFQPWPKDLVQDAYFIENQGDLNQLNGSVVRTAVAVGQPVTQGSLIRAGDRGFLAAALGPGMRAVTVPVNQQSSVAGFIFPGDRIDLMLTQSIAGGGDGAPLKVSETILKNLRVLATDQRTDAIGTDGKPVVQTYSNVTLEVTPGMAEKISVAQTIGAISLSLRSLADTSEDLELALANGDIDAPKAGDANAEKKMIAQLAARPNDRGATYSTGADVSRYQRSSVPGKVEDPNAIRGQVAPGNGSAGLGPVVNIARGTSVSAVKVGSK